MSNAEERREAGASLMFAGLAVWVAALLVLFFLPAAMKIGHEGRFATILIMALGVMGAALMGGGWRMRRGGSE
jgi:phosphatidylserine synthase